jgi:hypothetical protein
MENWRLLGCKAADANGLLPVNQLVLMLTKDAISSGHNDIPVAPGYAPSHART